MDKIKKDSYWRIHRFVSPFIQLYARTEPRGSNFQFITDEAYIIASNYSGHLWWDILTLIQLFKKKKIRVLGHHWDKTIDLSKRVL